MRLDNPTTRTAILLGVLTAILVIIGYFISGVGGAIMFLILSIIMNVATYWFSDRIALSMAQAKPVDESQAPDIYKDIRELSQKAGIPMPKVFYTEDIQPNAFATGRNPENSSICITKGLLNVLNRNEVRAVLGHELAHIKNHDVLITSVAAVMAGAIASISNLALFSSGVRSNKDRNTASDVLLIILTPIAAVLIQLAVSRSRELQADETGAKLAGTPTDLANALIKLDQAAAQVPYVQANPALSPLFIQNPFKGDSLFNLFSTHPTTQERVSRLMSMQK